MAMAVVVPVAIVLSTPVLLKHATHVGARGDRVALRQCHRWYRTGRDALVLALMLAAVLALAPAPATGVAHADPDIGDTRECPRAMRKA